MEDIDKKNICAVLETRNCDLNCMWFVYLKQMSFVDSVTSVIVCAWFTV